MARIALGLLIALVVACNPDKAKDDTSGISETDTDTDTDSDTDTDTDTDNDGDGYGEDDCDDTDPDVHPGADETCNGIDDNCNGMIDEDVGTTWYQDNDGDGYGNDAVTVRACNPLEGYVAMGGDCNDEDAAYYPGAPEEDCEDPNDYNCDGSTGTDDADGDGHIACQDCNDADAATYPGADEVCDGADNDCDGDIDDDAVDGTTFYADTDGDGFGDAGATTMACDLPSGFVTDDTDCDDTDAAVNPDAEEVCDGIDNNCDGGVDTDATGTVTWYQDGDGDGYGDATVSTESCEQPTGYVLDDTDCDDADATVYPGAEELCDGLDNDCNGDVDDGVTDLADWYADTDGDGYGDPSDMVTDCEQPTGYVADGTDCDDTDAGNYPGADEYCDEVDNDCDGDVDEDAVDDRAWYVDSDGDGYGDGTSYVYACEMPSGYARSWKDCDDTDATVNPKGEEVCDGKDNDCDGDTDFGFSVPDTYGTIGDAISAASDGDIICVAGGTYTETIDFDGKDVVVWGYEGSGSTTIDGDGDGPVVTFNNRESDDAKLIGFTITGGEEEYGAGIYIDNADPTFEDLVVTGNTCSGTANSCNGVGMYVNDSKSTFTDVEVSGNVASAVYYRGYYGYAYGVGMHIDDSDLVFQDVVVADNEHATAAYSTQMSSGVGVYLTNADLVWSGGRVSGNTSSGSSGYEYGKGGGIMLSGTDLEMSHVVIADNVLDGSYYSWGGGIYLYYYSDAELTNVIIANNEVTGSGPYYGGAGGGVYIGQYAVATLTNCDVVGNYAEQEGGGIYGYYYADVEMVNTNVVGNEADDGGAMGGYSAAYLGSTDITYCNFYDNGTDDFEDYSDPTGSDGNIAVDPMYADISPSDGVDWDLTLDASSSCVDAGDPSISDADGSTSDIGAFGGPGGASW